MLIKILVIIFIFLTNIFCIQSQKKDTNLQKVEEEPISQEIQSGEKYRTEDMGEMKHWYISIYNVKDERIANLIIETFQEVLPDDEILKESSLPLLYKKNENEIYSQLIFNRFYPGLALKISRGLARKNIYTKLVRTSINTHNWTVLEDSNEIVVVPNNQGFSNKYPAKK